MTPKLNSLTVSQLLQNSPNKKPSLISCSAQTSVESVLGLLARENILSLPVADPSTGEYTAILNILDLLQFVVFASCQEDMPGHLDVEKMFQLKTGVGNLLAGGDGAKDPRRESFRLWQYPQSSSLKPILEAFSKGVHRCLITSPDTHALILTQSDILYYLHHNMETALPSEWLDKSIQDLGLFPSKSVNQYGFPQPVLSIPRSTTALKAFRRMVIEDVSAFPLTDEQGHLVGTLSASNLRGMEVLKLNDLLLPADKFLEKHPSKHMQQLTVKPTSTLREVIVTFASTRVHHLWVVNDVKAPIGVLTCTDLMQKFFMG